MSDADRPLRDDFADDADHEHPWAERFRIPVIRSPHPRWRYEVALYVRTEPSLFGIVTGVPDEAEAAMVGSYIDCRRSYYNDRWQRLMLNRPFDVDSGTNTVVLVKYDSGSWGYRRDSWTYGPMFVPNADDSQTLPQVLDRIDSFNWKKWRAEHDDIFKNAAEAKA